MTSTSEVTIPGIVDLQDMRLDHSLCLTQLNGAQPDVDGQVYVWREPGSFTGVALWGNGGGAEGRSPSRLSDALPSLFTPVSSSFKVRAFGAGRTYYASC